MTSLTIDGGFTPRGYQLPYMNARDAGCKFAVWVCHRRGGKDRTALAQTAKDSIKRVGLYWHCLPTLRQARKVIWDGITSEGKNLIRATFPDALVARRLEDDMKLELKNGSIVQLVGADNFDALVGSNPVHVTFSEWALTDPRAYDYVRPILRENNGSVSFIFTPRGYNHGYKTLQIAKALPGAFVAVMSIRETGVLTDDDIALERAMGMPEELIEQEYYVDFAAANVGAIVGRYVSAMEREGRLLQSRIRRHLTDIKQSLSPIPNQPPIRNSTSRRRSQPWPVAKTRTTTLSASTSSRWSTSSSVCACSSCAP